MKKDFSISKVIKYASLLLVILQSIIFLLIIFIVNFSKEDNSLLKQKITLIAIISIALTVFFGNIIIILSIRFISRPLKRINYDLEKVAFGSTTKIPKTKIKELNSLIDSVEKLNQSALSYSSTLSIAMDRFSIGIFFSVDRKDVYLTQSFFDICELDEVEGYYPYQDFQSFFDFITANPHPDIASTYRIGADKWVNITTNQEKPFLLGIVNDSTNQVLEIERLEKERDFDHLTNLYLRPAFTKEAEKYFEDRKEK